MMIAGTARWAMLVGALAGQIELGHALCDDAPPARRSGGLQPSTSIARVVADDAANDTRGAMTIIDRRRRLLISASHVIPGETVRFLFPGIDADDPNLLRKGRVIYRIAEADGTADYEGKVWGEARDIVIVQADKALPDFSAPAELRPRMTQFTHLKFYGFPEGVVVPTPSPETEATVPQIDLGPGRQPVKMKDARCTKALRTDTINGDSGSPVFDDDGYLVGVIIQAKGLLVQADSSTTNKYPGRWAIFVRTGCFFETMAQALPDIDNQKLDEDLATKSQSYVNQMLAAYPSAGGVDSFDLFTSAVRLGSAIRRDKIPPTDPRYDVYWCSVLAAFNNRGMEFGPVEQIAMATATPVATADNLVRKAGAPSDASDPKARQLYAAIDIYHSELRSTLNSPTGQPTPGVDERLSPQAAIAMKSLADANLKLSKVSAEPALLLEEAKRTASLAALSAPNAEVKGEALTTLAAAVRRQGDYTTSVRAMRAAQTEGTPSASLKKSISFLMSLIDANDLAATKPLTVDDLRQLAMRQE